MKKIITIILIMLFIASHVCWAVEKGPLSASERLSRSDFRSLDYAQSQLKADKDENARRARIEKARQNFYLDRIDKNVSKNIFMAVKDRLKDKNDIQAEANKLKQLASRAVINRVQKIEPAEPEEPLMQTAAKEENGTLLVITENVANDDSYIHTERQYAYDEEKQLYLLVRVKEVVTSDSAYDLVREINTYGIKIEDGIVKGYTQNISEKDISTNGGQFSMEYTIVRSDIEYDEDGRPVSYKDAAYADDGKLDQTLITIRTNIIYKENTAAYSKIQIDLLGGDVQIEIDSAQEGVIKFREDGKEVNIDISFADDKNSSKRGSRDLLLTYSQVQAGQSGEDSDVIQQLDRLIESILRYLQDEHKTDPVSVPKLDIADSDDTDGPDKLEDVKNAAPPSIQELYSPDYNIDLNYNSVYEIRKEQINQRVAKKILESLLELVSRGAVNKNISGQNFLLKDNSISGIIRKGALAIDIVTLPQRINIEQLIAAFIHLECRLNSLKNEYEVSQPNPNRVSDRITYILAQEALGIRIHQKNNKLNAEDTAVLDNRIRNAAGIEDASALSVLSLKIDAIVAKFNTEAAEALGNGSGAAIIEDNTRENATVVISLPSETK